MYTHVLQQIGLAKNEARIYETLLCEGELAVGAIAMTSRVHRRNVYDSLKRLVARGLVYEIPGKNETTYEAVGPERLLGFIKEKKKLLDEILPNLEALHRRKPQKHSVYIYRGPEGWKNYMRDMLNVSKDAYFIAAKGGWLDVRVKHFLPYFLEEAQKRNIRFYHLFDHEVKEECPMIIPKIGNDYKFLPKGYSAPGVVDIFGDYVNLISKLNLGSHPEEISFTVIVNKQIADSFRSWFRLMWDICPTDHEMRPSV